MTRATAIISALLIALFIPKIARAQQPASYRPPTPQEVMVRRGSAVFAANCTGYCHGNSGTPGTGAPALAGRGFDIDYILKTVMYGIQGTTMQAWGQRIPKDDSAAVIAYVGSLNGITAMPSAAPVALTGEAAHGRELFLDAEGELRRCSNCHQVNGRGLAVTPAIANVPADISGLKKPATPHVSLATVDGQSFPALVVAKLRDETKLYDLTTFPPVLRIFAPSTVTLADKSSWDHASVTGSYSDAELGAILEFLKASRRP